MSSSVLANLRRMKVVPLIVIDEPDRASQLARALVAGGLPCAEIALRTPGALEALRRISEEHPDVVAGAGTVLPVQQAVAARRAGAQFIVTPGFSPRVVDYCHEHALPIFPGVCTPTEIGAAVERGHRVLKFFPAEQIGGLPYLQAIAGPFPDVEFIPTGGINAGNLASYLRFRQVVACGGSWMAPHAWIAAGGFDRIRAEVAMAMQLAASTNAHG